MVIAKVVGNVWSTKKNDRIHALRLLFVQPLGRDLEPAGEVLVAADEIGAGVGELVLVVRGSPAMEAVGDGQGRAPVDAAVVGIVDSLDLSQDQGDD